MRTNRPIDHILGRRSNVALLRCLVLSRIETTGRDLARTVHLDHKTCSAALADLCHEGLITMRVVGRARLYALREGFPLIDEVLLPLFEWERNLPKRLSGDIMKGLGPEAVSIFLFGSTAKGTDTGKSDIDLFVVTSDKDAIERLEAKADRLIADLIRSYGRVPAVLFVDIREFHSMHRKKDPFLREVLRSGTLLHGLRVEELLNHGRKEDRHRRGVSPTKPLV